MNDKERIEAIIRDKNLSNVEFCNQTAMAPSTLSHIISQRTKPTIAILRNVVEAFPDINPMWILLGQGEMYLPQNDPADTMDLGATGIEGVDAPILDSGVDDIFSSLRNGLQPAASAQASVPPSVASSGQRQPVGNRQVPPAIVIPNQRQQVAAPQINIDEVVGATLTRLQKPQRRVTEVRIFFDDGTYETFSAK